MNRVALLALFCLLVSIMLTGCRPQQAQAGAVDREYTLTTRVGDGRIIYVGVGGENDGLVNPDLIVSAGERVRITLINGDGMPHDISLPDFNAKSPLAAGRGGTTSVEFTADADRKGRYPYFCTQPGHRQAGQEGVLIVR